MIISNYSGSYLDEAGRGRRELALPVCLVDLFSFPVGELIARGSIRDRHVDTEIKMGTYDTLVKLA